MKFTKKILCLLLCCALVMPCASLMSSASDAVGNHYPIIFVHGLNGWGSSEGIDSVVPYWGATTGSLVKYLGDNGYECVAASVGPISSAWDRACELYAQIAGTTVDYGAAHSAANGHLRYGRTYETGLVENWGELDAAGKINKVHIIGHSFGGTTARMLVQLLAQGSAEERAAAPDNCSPLFEGGHSNMVSSITCICTPHESSTIYYPVKLLGILDMYKYFSVIYVGIFGRSPANGDTVDFHMEQFGLSAIPGEEASDSLIVAAARVIENSQDLAQYDLTPQGTKAVNDFIDIQDGVYYFSQAFSTTKKIEPLHISVPNASTNPVIALCAAAMGMTIYLKDLSLGTEYGEEWQSNDALVNTISEMHPADEPYTDYDASMPVKSGVWNVLPVQEGDHGTAIGLLADEEKTQSYYLELAQRLAALPE